MGSSSRDLVIVHQRACTQHVLCFTLRDDSIILSKIYTSGFTKGKKKTSPSSHSCAPDPHLASRQEKREYVICSQVKGRNNVTQALSVFLWGLWSAWQRQHLGFSDRRRPAAGTRTSPSVFQTPSALVPVDRRGGLLLSVMSHQSQFGFGAVGGGGVEGGGRCCGSVGVLGGSVDGVGRRQSGGGRGGGHVVLLPLARRTETLGYLGERL